MSVGVPVNPKTFQEHLRPGHYSTRCRFCGETFRSKPFVPLINPPSGELDSRRKEMVRVLQSHAIGKHGDIVLSMMLAVCYQFEDPIIAGELETARWIAHGNATRHYPDDAFVVEKFSAAGFDEEQIKAVLGLRDLLTETGIFAVIKPKEQVPA